MTGSIDTNRSLAYGLVLSIALHAAAVFGMVNAGVFAGRGDTETVLFIPPPEEQEKAEQPKPPDPKTPEPAPVKLGNDESSDPNSKTWIGAKEATPHTGLKSDVEQPQVAPPKSKPSDPEEEEPPATTGAPQPPSAGSPSPTPPTPDDKPDQPETPPAPPSPPVPPAPPTPPKDTPQPEQPPAKPEEPTPPAETKPREEPAPKADPLPEAPKEEPKTEPAQAETPKEDLPSAESPEALPDFQARPIQPPPAPAPAPVPVAKPTPPSPPPAPSPSSSANVPAGTQAKAFKSRSDYMGIADDRVAIATALKDATVVVPGQPVAAKGMRIRTVPPRPSVTTQITAAPRDAVMWVIFGPNGKVKDTDFLPGNNTGSEGWDGALRSAVFGWRASGEEIDKLSKTDPRAGVSVLFKITMR